MTSDIKAANSSYIGAVRGSDCEVEIFLYVPNARLPMVQGRRAGGAYDSGKDRILLSRGAGERVVVHEVTHALTTTRDGPVEHGLVTAAESLRMGGGWSYGNENYTGTPPFVSAATHHSVAHIFYKLSSRVTKVEAFEIFTKTDLEEPTSASAHGVIFREAKEAGAETAVTEIYKGMGIWPSQADIDDIVDSVIREIERRVGTLQVPPRAEMEDKVEEIVNEQLGNGVFNQGLIIVQAGKKAEEYRLEKVKELEKAKEKYKKLLKEAMAQLTNAERAEIQGQYSDAQRKIQAATSRAIAQSNWEWIRDVIERMIEGREDDDTQVPVAPRSPPKKPGNWPPGWPRPPGA